MKCEGGNVKIWQYDGNRRGGVCQNMTVDDNRGGGQTTLQNVWRNIWNIPKSFLYLFKYQHQLQQYAAISSCFSLSSFSWLNIKKYWWIDQDPVIEKGKISTKVQSLFKVHCPMLILFCFRNLFIIGVPEDSKGNTIFYARTSFCNQ